MRNIMYMKMQQIVKVYTVAHAHMKVYSYCKDLSFSISIEFFEKAREDYKASLKLDPKNDETAKAVFGVSIIHVLFLKNFNAKNIFNIKVY